jgi:hypothetical protein
MKNLVTTNEWGKHEKQILKNRMQTFHTEFTNTKCYLYWLETYRKLQNTKCFVFMKRIRKEFGVEHVRHLNTLFLGILNILF